MDFLNVASSLGPVAGTVIVVVLFTRFATTYMKNERFHREKVAKECHDVQEKATEATFKATEAIDQNTTVLNQVCRTLIRMNGDSR